MVLPRLVQIWLRIDFSAKDEVFKTLAQITPDEAITKNLKGCMDKFSGMDFALGSGGNCVNLAKGLGLSFNSVLSFSPRFPQRRENKFSRRNALLRKSNFLVAPDLVNHRPVCIAHGGDVVPVRFPFCTRRSGA